MTDVRCPMCGKPNPEERDECRYCGARLKPVLPGTPINPQTLKPGSVPTKRDTSEFEKVKLPGQAPIHPGEAPTKKDTAELERALPTWLRSLREGDQLAGGESLEEPSPDESTPNPPHGTSAPDSSGHLPDWFSGLGKAGSDEETVPDWLADLRGGKPPESTSAPVAAESTSASVMEEEPAPELGNEDWLKRLEGEHGKAAPGPGDTAKFPTAELLGAKTPPVPPPESNFPDWLHSVQSPVSGIPEEPASKQEGEKLPDWLSSMPGIPTESHPPRGETEGPASIKSLPAWLDQPDQKSATPETGAPAGTGESIPDWLSSFNSVPEGPSSTAAENVPDWLSGLETKPEPGLEKPAALLGGEPPVAGTSDWLSQLQTEVNAEQGAVKPKQDSEFTPETPTSPEGTAPLPDWMAGIESPAPSSRVTPALIPESVGTPPGRGAETAIPMEMPDWLSKLKPDLGTEKTAGAKESPEESEKIAAAELPSWVQALRPVEAVVESKTMPVEENQAAELTGPLAGLRGVLPVGPGLGLLRKRPAYSSKLQASEAQQRYATSLEQLVAGEAEPRVVKTTRLPSSRLWRWGIAVLLFLAVGLPFVGGIHITPATLLLSSDKGASSKIIDELPANIPVLVSFDYDPALAGELEAVAAPLLDHLLSKGTPLALISTSPTGPALAEHFLETTSLVNVHQYQSGSQYVNLGYLAGGSAGILYLADSLRLAVPVSVDGKPAWETGPLQDIQNLSDFAAVIVLTDNADTGRNWVEQAGARLGNTPMLMVISAQAEPMIQPYFDSGQLKGLISGLTDAKIYEQAYDRPGLANHYWNSFSFGMLAAELVIIAGAILGIMADRRARRKDIRGEA